MGHSDGTGTFGNEYRAGKIGAGLLIGLLLVLAGCGDGLAPTCPENDACGTGSGGGPDLAVDATIPDDGGAGDASTGCTPESDAQFCQGQGATCGVVAAVDNCGAQRAVDCGQCGANASCGGGGTPHQCGCIAESDAAFCARSS